MKIQYRHVLEMTPRLPVEKNGQELIEEMQDAEDKVKGSPMGREDRICF